MIVKCVDCGGPAKGTKCCETCGVTLCYRCWLVRNLCNECVDADNEANDRMEARRDWAERMEDE